MRKTLFPIFAGIILLATACTSAPQQVSMFYYDPDLDLDANGNIQCSADGLAPVERELSGATDRMGKIAWTIRFLLEGELTDEERARGLTTEYPLEGVDLLNVALQDGVLTLTFSDPSHLTSGGACRATILWLQVEQTALQFDGVEEVRFEPADLFQP